MKFMLCYIWVGKFGKYLFFFFGGLSLSREFWGYSEQSQDSWPRSSVNKFQPNLGSEIRHEIFWGWIFGPGIFSGLIFAPIRSSPSLGIWCTPPAVLVTIYLWVSQISFTQQNAIVFSSFVIVLIFCFPL